MPPETLNLRRYSALMADLIRLLRQGTMPQLLVPNSWTRGDCGLGRAENQKHGQVAAVFLERVDGT